MVIGCDFDGTVVKSAYPKIGRFKFGAKFVLRWLYRRGHTLVLWTCRERLLLDEAIWACRMQGINFHYFNENTDERIEQYGGDCRKLSCDILVDDTAGFVFWPWVIVRVLCKEVRL